jgi:hypothetical protein
MADEAFQRRAGEAGRQAQAMARKVLHGCGFRDLRANERRPRLGVTVNFIGHDNAGKEWYFDVSGAFTSQRAGLLRTDTMWKRLGRANVLHQAGIERLVLLTTNPPKADSAGHCALTAAAPTFFDAIEMLTSQGKARLTLYAQGERYARYLVCAPHHSSTAKSPAGPLAPISRSVSLSSRLRRPCQRE